ncbi:DUF1257 domain-containing protein [bacterium]|nr:DUF1257 domain-containing protein [bacterium]MBU1026056.1 DUF1257 domain-containing protein [bacterium]
MSGCLFFPPLIVFEIPFFAVLLAELGYHVFASVSQVSRLKGQASRFQQCDVVFATKGGVEVGLVFQEGGAFNLVCDEAKLEQVEGLSPIELKNQLSQKYTHKKVYDELTKHGFSIVEEEVLEDNTVKIKVRRWI